jgi:hypothetical protein
MQIHDIIANKFQEFETRMTQNTRYMEHGAEVSESRLLPQGINVTPFDHEPLKAFMSWEKWNTGFQELKIPGLSYRGCQLVVGYYRYAARGNRDNPQLSRSQSVVSSWGVEDPKIAPLASTVEGGGISAFFPVYDGVGFWIGKRRREEGVRHYSETEEVAIAKASALGALGIGKPFGSPQEPGHTMYQCVWAPGKAFKDSGQIIPSATTTAFQEIGFSVHQLSRPSRDNPERTFRVYGNAHTQKVTGERVPIPFTTDLAEALMPAWKYVNSFPFEPTPPDPESY